MINISQSFLKEYAKYKGGEVCGLQVKAKYIDNIQFPTSLAMDLGNFFEFSATGCLPRDGKIPYPKIVYKGTAKETIAEPFQRAIQSAQLFNTIVKAYGIQIIETGKVVTQDGMTGIMDIVANWNDEICIIDTKYSGMIDDKWSDFGWDLDKLPEKHGLMIQAVHYKILLAKELGVEPEDINFYFFVFSSLEVMNVKLIKVNTEEATFSQHLLTVEWLKKELKQPYERVFKALPQFKRCFECPINADCKEKVEIPQINEIVY